MLVATALVLNGAGVSAATELWEDFYKGRAAPSDWLPQPRCELTTALSSKASFKALAGCHAARYGMPPALAHAVMEIESRFNPEAKGAAGEVGLMQVMPATARLLGFRGSGDELADPATNIPLGVRYLAQAYQLARGDLCTTVMKYRAGHRESRFSVLSVHYCEKARAILEREGQPVVGVLPVATFGFNAFKESTATGGGRNAKGVCTRRVLVPGPRYMKCAEYQSTRSAKSIRALRSRLFGS
jgi:hypothetical protein